jgi:CRP-like cAMP-binding protein
MIPRFPIFSRISVSDIDQFAAGADIKEYLPDEIILSEGKKVDSFYLVMQGSVRMEKMVSVKSNNNWPKSKDKWQNV